MKIIRKAFHVLNKANSDHIGEYAANCAYYTFLSFIPFIILLFSVIKYVDIEKDTLIYILEAFLPNIMKESSFDIIQEMYSKSTETISLSVIFMLWSSSRGFYSLNKGLSSIYKREEERSYIIQRIKGMVGAIIALFLIILVLILLVFGNLVDETITNHFKELNSILKFILNIRAIISVISMFFIFLIMYKVTSKERGERLRSYWKGSAFASISWYLVSYFFSIYVNIFTNFSIIYGSLGTIILIMMWLYTIIYTILLGAEINSYYKT